MHADPQALQCQQIDSLQLRQEATLVTQHALSLQDPSLLRAVGVGKVLRCGGRVLGTASGTAETYNLSVVANRIDYFISHNWSVSRTIKFLTIVLHFGHSRAFAASVSVVTLTTILTGFHVLPIVKDELGSAGICAHVCGVPVFLFALIFGGDICSLIGLHGPSVFLDKICIHQTDQDVKRRGIESLGAFLSFSSRMVVVFGHEYLEKLWTVYEVATYLALGSTSRIVLCPPFMTKLVLAQMVVVYMSFLCYRWIVLFYGNEYAQILPIEVAFLSFGLLHVIGFRLWFRRLEAMLSTVLTFDTTMAMCFDERDRPLVNGFIVAYMKSLARCHAHAEDKVALQAFDALVRREIPAAMSSSIGKAGLPYRYVIVIYQAHLWVVFDRIGGMIADGTGFEDVLIYLFHRLLDCMICQPLVVAMVAFLTRRCLHLRGFKEWSFVLGMTLLFLCYTNVNLVIFFSMPRLAKESAVVLGAECAVAFVLIYITWRVYRYHHYDFAADIPHAEGDVSRGTHSLTPGISSSIPSPDRPDGVILPTTSIDSHAIGKRQKSS